MNRHRAFVFFSAASIVAASAVLINCEDDVNPATPSTTFDGSNDTGQGVDGAVNLVDSGKNDTGGGTDSGTDTGTDAGDAGADVDAGPVIPTIVGLDDTGKLIRFKADSPGVLLGAAVTITGLKAGDSVVGIDFRPANGLLYGVGKLGHVYTIDKNTAVATVVNDIAFSPPPNGTFFGVDVNPVADRLRLHTDTQQNFRLHFADGGIAGLDTALSYAVGDINNGATPLISASAYTNSVSPTPLITSLFAIDTQLNALVLVNPPNNGTLNTVGPLGVTPTDVAGFDIYGGIAGDGGFPQLDKPQVAYAALVITAAQPELYTINLTTGAATKVGNINHTAVLIGIAVEP